MCMCKSPTVNGEPGYSWDGKTIGVRQPDPPAIEPGDELLADDPGRCGGLDSHCHHFRLVKRYGVIMLLVRNGSGDHAYHLGSHRPGIKPLLEMDSSERYWLLQLFYHTMMGHTRERVEATNNEWRVAAAEKRIKTRKVRNSDAVKVWITTA